MAILANLSENRGARMPSQSGPELESLKPSLRGSRPVGESGFHARLFRKSS
jgi:hypothetical protein